MQLSLSILPASPLRNPVHDEKSILDEIWSPVLLFLEHDKSGLRILFLEYYSGVLIMFDNRHT